MPPALPPALAEVDEDEGEAGATSHRLRLLPAASPSPDSFPLRPRHSCGLCFAVLAGAAAAGLLLCAALWLLCSTSDDWWLSSSVPLAGLSAGDAGVGGLGPLLPSSPPALSSSCVLPVYHPDDPSSSDMNLHFLFGFMLDFLPSACACAVRPRLWSDFREDYLRAIGQGEGDLSQKELVAPPAGLRFPLVYVVQMWEFKDRALLQLCLLSPAFCRANVVLVHQGDEHLLAPKGDVSPSDDWTKAVPYSLFHSVFRQYHSPPLDDFSYAAFDLLRLGGFSEADLRLSSQGPPPSSPVASHAAEAERRLAELMRATPPGPCPFLLVPLQWQPLIDAVAAFLASQPDPASILSPSHLPAASLSALSARLQSLVDDSRRVSSTSPACHLLPLLAVHLQGQAALLDFEREKAEAASAFNFSDSRGPPLLPRLLDAPGPHACGHPRGAEERTIGLLRTQPPVGLDGLRQRERGENGPAAGPPGGAQCGHGAEAGEMRRRGLFHDTERFAAGLRGIRWTAFLADATFMPLPAGNVADQYRLHEALEAGALPIIASTHITGGTREAELATRPGAGPSAPVPAQQLLLLSRRRLPSAVPARLHRRLVPGRSVRPLSAAHALPQAEGR